jgi:ribonuclease J
MAMGEDPHIKISKDDVVFITTTPSTAMEAVVAKTRDMLFKHGADVKQISQDVRSSGHASRNDFQMLVNLLKPTYVMPIQGEYRVMNAAKQLAEEVGIASDHVLMAMKGDQFQYIDGAFELKDSFTIGETMIDGSGIGDIGNIVLRDRKILSEDGVFVSVVTIDRKKRKVVSKPKLTSRGFVYVKANRDLMREAADLTVKQIEDYLANAKQFDWNDLKNGVRDVVAKFLFEQTRRRPVVMPVVMEVNQNRRPSNRPRLAKDSDATGEAKPKRRKKKPAKAATNQTQQAATATDEQKGNKPKRRRPRRKTPATSTTDTTTQA